jgi:hypothetical protein
MTVATPLDQQCINTLRFLAVDIEASIITEEVVYLFTVILDEYNDSRFQHMSEIFTENPAPSRDDND